MEQSKINLVELIFDIGYSKFNFGNLNDSYCPSVLYCQCGALERRSGGAAE